MKKIALFIIVAATIAACQNGGKVVIKGQFFGANNKNIILEELSPSGGKIVDSIRANTDGKFKFEIDMSEKSDPAFYNIRLNNQFVPLLIDKGENIEVNAVGNISVNYDVKGSKGSELLREFNTQTNTQKNKIDSIINLYETTTDRIRKAELGRESGREYIRLKQMAIRFVMTNASSLVAIVPLYRPTFDGSFLFDQPTDIVYFRAIADSLETYYPTSAYVKSLRNDIKRVDNVILMDSLVSEGINNATSYPELSIKDAKGKVQTLSSLNGKVILLNFTSSADAGLKIMNRELLDTYNKYHDKGFEIYEVSIDTDKALWLKGVSENRLPWIQVCDFMGANSPARAAYNVSKLPAYFLINASGEIAEANINHGDIDSAVAKLIQ